MKKTTKRILSFVLSCVFICSGLVSVTAEESKKLDKAKNLISALNIVDDSTNELVTRERFADVFVKANNMYPEGYEASNPFDDTAESAYADSIHIMRDHGLINGVGDNLFAPSEKMLLQDMTRLYIAALGLDAYQKSTGKSFMEVAYEVNLFSGIGVSDYITMDSLIQMTYNFLMAPMGMRNFTEKESYTINHDTNVLYEKFDVYKISGRVIQNDMSGIWTPAGAEEGYVVIQTKDGELTALAGESGIEQMLAQYVDIYLQESDGEDKYKVVCYEERSSDKSVTINIKDIDFDTSDNSVISYYKEGRSSLASEDLVDFPAFIINGVYYDAGQFDISNIEKYTGQIKLLCTSGSKYDVVLIEAYTNYYVKNVEHYAGEMRIYDSGSNEALNLNSENYKNIEIYHPNGAGASQFELQAGMLLTVAKSFGTEKNVKIYICDSVETGTISGYDLDEMTITLDQEKEFDISPAYNSTSIPLGTAVKLYMDKFGNVAWVEYDRTAEFSYAYMKKGLRIDHNEYKVKVKVVVESGKFTTMYLAEKVLIDGLSYKTPEEQLYQLESVETFECLAAGEYPFRYRLNSDGEIREIDTPRVRQGTESKNTTLHFDSSQERAMYHNKILAMQTPVSANAVVFLIPESTATEELNEQEFHAVGNDSLLSGNSDNKYAAFKVGNDSMCVDLVIKTKKYISTSFSHDEVLFLVDDIKDVLDEQYNEIRTKVTGLEGGARKEYFLHEQCDRSAFDGISRGDVVRFRFYSGEIAAVQPIYMYDKATNTRTFRWVSQVKANNIFDTNYAYYYAGYVQKREGNLIEIIPFDIDLTQNKSTTVYELPYKDEDKRRVFRAPTGISVYDPSLGKKEAVYGGDLEDITAFEDRGEYSKVIVRYKSRSVQEMILLKNEGLERGPQQ